MKTTFNQQNRWAARAPGHEHANSMHKTSTTAQFAPSSLDTGAEAAAQNTKNFHLPHQVIPGLSWIVSCTKRCTASAEVGHILSALLPSGCQPIDLNITECSTLLRQRYVNASEDLQDSLHKLQALSEPRALASAV